MLMTKAQKRKAEDTGLSGGMGVGQTSLSMQQKDIALMKGKDFTNDFATIMAVFHHHAFRTGHH